MSLLEINSKAKPAATSAASLLNKPLKKYTFVVGKKYITKSGCTAVCVETGPQIRIRVPAISQHPYVYNEYGQYAGVENILTFGYHIAREWISEEHDAWLEGKPIQGKFHPGTWFTFPSKGAYAPANMEAVENQWFKCKDGTRQVRIAP